MKAPTLDLDDFVLLPFPVATTGELRSAGMLRVEAMGKELCVLWNEGSPRVYRDACAHLGLPLTLGRQKGGHVRCRYHGWTYRTDDGEVVEQPGLRKAQPCRLARFGCLVEGGLVFAWLGDPEAGEAVRRRLPPQVLEGFSLFRVEFNCPFYLALFSSVDYAHFAFHKLYKPLYRIYGATRSNRHEPGDSFPARVVEEDERSVTVAIAAAEREIRMFATAAEMDDGGVNFFQTFVTPISPMKTLYWECYKPRWNNLVINGAARLAFRLFTTRLLQDEDRVWTGAAAPNFVEGGNIHLSENDVALGAHLRKFVLPVTSGGKEGEA